MSQQDGSTMDLLTRILPRFRACPSCVFKDSRAVVSYFRVAGEYQSSIERGRNINLVLNVGG